MFWRANRNKAAAGLTLVAGLLFYFAYSVTAEKCDPTKELYYPTEDDFAKLERFMDETWRDIDKWQTEGDVTAILGPPHRILTWESSKRYFHGPHEPGEKVFYYKAAPNEDVECYHVSFNVNGHVNGLSRTLVDKRSLSDKIKAWLKYGF